MNKPAPKEPSMDEILSSIRQIIADDDAAVAPKKPAGLGTSPLVSPAPPIRPALAPRPAQHRTALSRSLTVTCQSSARPARLVQTM